VLLNSDVYFNIVIAIFIKCYQILLPLPVQSIHAGFFKVWFKGTPRNVMRPHFF